MALLKILTRRGSRGLARFGGYGWGVEKRGEAVMDRSAKEGVGEVRQSRTEGEG